MLFPDLDTPSVLVDLDVLERNLAAMQARADAAAVRLRPHTKTHKSASIGRMQVAAGATGLTVAKLGEAEALAGAGLDDLLVAYPILGEPKLRRLRALLDRGARLILSLDDPAQAEGVARVAREAGLTLPVYVDVDSGLGRLGRQPGREAADVALAIARHQGLEVVGLMTHAGYSYRAEDEKALRAAARQEAEALAKTAEVLAKDGLVVRELSAGSTPTAFVVDEAVRVAPITEIRPGTYAFNDVNQWSLGVAREEDCALTILATIISRPATDRVVIDAGSKTLGADSNPRAGQGRIKGAPHALITKLSEEHGVVQVSPDDAYQVGDRLQVIPVHACIPPNLASELVGTRGERVEREMAVEGRGANR